MVTYVFGDNKTVVNASSVPHSKLNKRHNALSYHYVREAIAAGIMRMHHIRGPTNPADILSKHWDHATIWPVLRPLLSDNALTMVSLSLNTKVTISMGTPR